MTGERRQQEQYQHDQSDDRREHGNATQTLGARERTDDRDEPCGEPWRDSAHCTERERSSPWPLG